METEDLNKPGTDSQDSDQFGPSATFKLEASKVSFPGKRYIYVYL